MADRKRKYSDSEESDIYEVEFVYGKKISKKKAHYAVKWLGWPLSQMSWEPLTSFTQQSSYLVKRFETRLCYQIYYKKIMPSQGGIRIHVKGRFCQSFTLKRKIGDQKELKEQKEIKDQREQKQHKEQKEFKERKDFSEQKEQKEYKEIREIKKYHFPDTADPLLKAQFIINQVKREIQHLDIPLESLTKQEKKKKKTISKSIKTIGVSKPKEVVCYDIIPSIIKGTQIKEIIPNNSSVKKTKHQDWDLERDIKLLILSEQKEQKKRQESIEPKIQESKSKIEEVNKSGQVIKEQEEAKQQPIKVHSTKELKKIEEIERSDHISINSSQDYFDQKIKPIKESKKKRKDQSSDDEKYKGKSSKIKEVKKKQKLIAPKRKEIEQKPQKPQQKMKKNQKKDEERHQTPQQVDFNLEFEIDLFDEQQNANDQLSQANNVHQSDNKEQKEDQYLQNITPKRLFTSNIKSYQPRVVKSASRIQQNQQQEQVQNYKTERDYLNEIIVVQKKKEVEQYRSGSLKQILFKEPKGQSQVRTSQQIQQEIQRLQLEKIALNKPSRCSVPIIPKLKDSEVQTDEIQTYNPQIKVFDSFGQETQYQRIQIESIHSHKLLKGKLLFKCINEDGIEYLLEYAQLAQNCPTTLLDYMIVNSILI